MDCVVAPLDHSQLVPANAVNVTSPPSQNVVAPEAVISATGKGFTTTFVAEEVALQPFSLVTVTL